MNIKENKEYKFNCSFKFPFPDSTYKELECSCFLFDNNINIVSLVDNKRFSKHVYKITGELINFENYRSDIITCSADSINELTKIYKNKVKNINILTVVEFNVDLINIFNLMTESYSLDRANLRYSFIEYEMRNKNNSHLYKNVTFYTSYANFFTKFENKQYLCLDLFKDNNYYWYCISNSSGDKICKFIFEMEDLPTKYLFNLIHRENYNEKSYLINFEDLKNDFGKLTNTSYEMHCDIPEENISWAISCHFSYLFEIFKDNLPLSLF